MVVIATAEAFDADMTERIDRHKEMRPAQWSTEEEPVDICAVINRLSNEHTIIIDCLTVWVGNLFHREYSINEILQESTRLVSCLEARSGETIIVTNDVGLGVHPETELGRKYRDALGLVNSAVAKTAYQVLFMSAGRVTPMLDAEEFLRS